MGWTHTKGASKRDIINERIAPMSAGYGKVYVTLDYKVSGNQLWRLEVLRSTDGNDSDPTIVLDLLEKNPGYGWGYKDMTEAMGPYYYRCPLSFLDRAPVTNAEWRKGVVARSR